MDKQLKPLEEKANTTTRARLLYARSELARLRKKNAEVDSIYDDIANRFKPEDLSPVLLAQVGDFLYARGKKDRALTLYARLKDEYPKSDYVDYAYVGLGNAAIEAKKFPEALQLFTDAVDKYSG